MFNLNLIKIEKNLRLNNIMRSCRRVLLDKVLSHNVAKFHGYVLDIGGEKNNNKGTFTCSKDVNSWIYLNSNLKASPDIHADAASIPIASQEIDCFLLCEVLEHLEYPEKVIAEAFRVLKKSGFGIITMPFMYAKHGDPFDYQRWTDSNLSKKLIDAGFFVEEIIPMGGICSVVCDLIIACLWNLKASIYKKLFLRMIYMAVPIFLWCDNFFPSTRSIVTTGWAMVVRPVCKN